MQVRFGLVLAGVALGGVAAPAAAQSDRCTFVIENVDRLGSRVEVAPGTINYFAGGNVRLRCKDTRVSMASDSVAAYGGRIVQFIGRVQYRDSTVTMNADRGTYYKEGERWEARGNVDTRNLLNGSTLKGPSLDYFRQVPGVRDTTELYAVGRPTISYATTDSTGQAGEPYLIVADRVRMRGNQLIWAGGRVTIDRSDFSARGDSLRLDTGAGSGGTLLGTPSVRGLGSDSFALTGRRIDFTLDGRELTYVTARGEARAISVDVDLKADTIGLDIDSRQLTQTLAWGNGLRPEARSPDYAITADSLALDTPGQRLKETRAFGKAWVGGRPDSATQERDWLAGDTVVAQFAERDSAGTSRSVLQRIESTGGARSYRRIRNLPGGPPSLNYTRGDHIIVLMREQGDGVARVDFRGRVDGVQLEPVPPGTDSTAADSTAKDAKRPPPKFRGRAP